MIEDVHTNRAADCGTDHYLLIANLAIKKGKWYGRKKRQQAYVKLPKIAKNGKGSTKAEREKRKEYNEKYEAAKEKGAT